jgi:hypothetical protein
MPLSCTLLLFLFALSLALLFSLSLHSLPTASQPLGFYGLCSNGHCDCIAVAVAVAAIIVAVVVELLLQSHDDFDLSSCALCDTLSLSRTPVLPPVLVRVAFTDKTRHVA